MNINSNSNIEPVYEGSSQRFFRLDDGAKCFEKLGSCKIIPANTIIIKPGEIFSYCFYVKRGMVMAYDLSLNGSERDFNIMSDNSLLFESNLFSNESSSFYFKTLDITELVYIEKDVLLEAMKDNFEITEFVIKSLSNKFLSAINELRELSSYNATWRICNILMIFAKHCGEEFEGKILIRHRISQQLLSNMLGINRITTVRTMKNLKDLDIIEQTNGFYCIKDIEKLRKYKSEQEVLD